MSSLLPPGLLTVIGDPVTQLTLLSLLVAGLYCFARFYRSSQSSRLIALPAGRVVAVSRSASHSFSKTPEPEIRLVSGLGVEGDAHAGRTVQHRSRIATRGHEPNLRQVHLVHSELHDDLRAAGFGPLQPGQMGENITTAGLQLLALPQDTRLLIGSSAVVKLTGLRNPCTQLDGLQPGLMSALRPLDADGQVVRKAGVMSVVEVSGSVRAGDAVVVELPAQPHRPLEPV